MSRKRQIFNAHNETLLGSPVDDETACVHQWIQDNYFDSMLIRLRRVIDTRRGTMSLPNILGALAKNGSALSFERYRRNWDDVRSFRSDEMAVKAYNRFSKDGRSFDTSRVTADLESLREQYATLLEHINSRVAHWSASPEQDEAPTVGEMNRLFDDVCEVFHDYYEFITLATIMDFPEVPLQPGFRRAFDRMVGDAGDET